MEKERGKQNFDQNGEQKILKNIFSRFFCWGGVVQAAGDLVGERGKGEHSCR